MRVRWFGSPWPSEHERAPVCEDDVDRIAVPAGLRCASGCGELIEAGDRGIACAFGGDEEAGLTFMVDDDNWFTCAVAYHIDCWVGQIIPEMRDLIVRRP